MEVGGAAHKSTDLMKDENPKKTEEALVCEEYSFGLNKECSTGLDF